MAATFTALTAGPTGGLVSLAGTAIMLAIRGLKPSDCHDPDIAPPLIGARVTAAAASAETSQVIRTRGALRRRSWPRALPAIRRSAARSSTARASRGSSTFRSNSRAPSLPGRTLTRCRLPFHQRIPVRTSLPRFRNSSSSSCRERKGQSSTSSSITPNRRHPSRNSSKRSAGLDVCRELPWKI
jgi:hypothetical protein